MSIWNTPFSNPYLAQSESPFPAIGKSPLQTWVTFPCWQMDGQMHGYHYSLQEPSLCLGIGFSVCLTNSISTAYWEWRDWPGGGSPILKLRVLQPYELLHMVITNCSMPCWLIGHVQCGTGIGILHYCIVPNQTSMIFWILYPTTC